MQRVPLSADFKSSYPVYIFKQFDPGISRELYLLTPSYIWLSLALHVGKTHWRSTVVTVQTQLLFFQMKHSISSVSMLVSVKSIWPMTRSVFLLPDFIFVFGVRAGK